MRAALVLVLLLVTGGTAVAQDRPAVGNASLDFTPSDAEVACTEALKTAKKEGKTPISAVVNTWDVCGPLYKADQNFVDFINDSLVLKLHDEEASRWTKDESSVIYAYVAIWMLTMGLVAAMFLRQQKLKGEIARLSSELASAMVDEPLAAKPGPKDKPKQPKTENA